MTCHPLLVKALSGLLLAANHQGSQDAGVLRLLLSRCSELQVALPTCTFPSRMLLLHLMQHGQLERRSQLLLAMPALWTRNQQAWQLLVRTSGACRADLLCCCIVFKRTGFSQTQTSLFASAQQVIVALASPVKMPGTCSACFTPPARTRILGQPGLSCPSFGWNDCVHCRASATCSHSTAASSCLDSTGR